MTPVEPVVGDLIGYRVFDLAGGRLSSISKQTTWEPGWNDADCARGKKHPAPDPHCGCGFWVYRTMMRALEQFDDDLEIQVPNSNGFGDFDGVRGVVLARVQIAGRVIVGTEGWRAERAAILNLYADDRAELLQETAEAYGVTVAPMPEIDWPIRGVIAAYEPGVLRMMRTEGERKWAIEDVRVELGSAQHLQLEADLLDRDVELRVTYERRSGELWATAIEEEA